MLASSLAPAQFRRIFGGLDLLLFKAQFKQAMHKLPQADSPFGGPNAHLSMASIYHLRAALP